MTGGTAAMGQSLRQMPSSRKGLPTRTDIATGKRTVTTQRPRGPFDIVGGFSDERIGQANRQRELRGNGEKRALNTAIVDQRGLLINGSSREPKAALGGGAETDAKRRRIGQLASQSQAAPKVGVNTPDLTRLAKDVEGLVYFQGMPSHGSVDADFYRNIGPSVRQPGSGNMIWGGFPNLPDTPFDRNYQNQGPGGAAYPGTASNDMFIDLGDRGRASRVAGNPLMNMSFSASASAKMESRSATGAPNALVPYTHRVSDAAQEWMPEEQRFHLWFTAVKAKDVPRASYLNQYETRRAPLPFHDGYNLVALNMAIAASQLAPQTRADVAMPEEILANYNLAGSVRVDVGSKLSGLGSHPGNRQNRNIVFEAQGPGDIFNIWDNPKVGQNLYIIIKGVPVEKIRAHGGAPAGTYNIEAEHPSHVERLPENTSSVPLQVVPWNDPLGFREPSLADLQYIDPFGIERYGVAIRVGWMLQRFPEDTDTETRAKAPYSVHNTMKCGRVRVYIDIQRCV